MSKNLVYYLASVCLCIFQYLRQFRDIGNGSCFFNKEITLLKKSIFTIIYFFILFTHLPTIISSLSDAFFLAIFHKSSVNTVLPELNIDVSELISAANMAASISPLKPFQNKYATYEK